jgi:hypothetical protein
MSFKGLISMENSFLHPEVFSGKMISYQNVDQISLQSSTDHFTYTPPADNSYPAIHPE